MPATTLTENVNAVAAATPESASVALVARQPIYGKALGLEYGVLSLAPVFLVAVLIQCIAAYFISKEAKAKA